MSRPKSIKRVRFDHWGYIFVAPFIIIFLAFQVYPIFNTFYLGFTNMKGTSTEHQLIGFTNFINTNYDVELKGKSADDANKIMSALNDANISAETDAPAPTSTTKDPFSLDTTSTDSNAAAPATTSAANDPYSLDSASTDSASPAPAASEDPYSLDQTAAVVPTDGYQISIKKISSEEASKVKDVFTSVGLSADEIEKSFTTAMGGLIFDLKFFWASFWNTIILWFFNFIPQIGFALLFAVWFTDVTLKLKFTGLFKTIYYMPNLVMPASIALLFANLFGWPNGPLNLFLVNQLHFNESVNFFRDEIMTRGIVSFIQFWMWYGSTLIVLIAGIVGIPESLYESAVVDGANSRQMFMKITLPLLRPVMSYTLITSMIGGLNMYDIPYLLTNRRGSPNDAINTTFMYIYNTAFGSNNNYSYAATISIGLFLIVLVLALIVFYLMRDKDEIASKKLRRLAK